MMSSPKRHRVLVLGAGIIGLSSAIRIQESCSNVDVVVMAEKFSPDTCSERSAGFWEPIAVGNTSQELLKEVADETYAYMLDLSLSPLARISGVQRISGYQMWNNERGENQAAQLKDTADGYRQMTRKELSRIEGAKDGCFFTTMTIDVTPHLKWLTSRILSNGGHFINKKIHSLSELSTGWDVVVNCTGMGSYHLLNDRRMYPVRGQVFKIHAPWVKHFYMFDTSSGAIPKLTYILPNFETVVVGGVFQKDNWNESIDENDEKDIWERNLRLVPSLKEATILDKWAALRPSRDVMRLESEVAEVGEEKTNLRIVHNYGHGGGGISLHWGCARKAVEMVTRFLQDIDADTREQRTINHTQQSKL